MTRGLVGGVGSLYSQQSQSSQTLVNIVQYLQSVPNPREALRQNAVEFCLALQIPTDQDTENCSHVLEALIQQLIGVQLIDSLASQHHFMPQHHPQIMLTPQRCKPYRSSFDTMSESAITQSTMSQSIMPQSTMSQSAMSQSDSSHISDNYSLYHVPDDSHHQPYPHHSPVLSNQSNGPISQHPDTLVNQNGLQTTHYPKTLKPLSFDSEQKRAPIIQSASTTSSSAARMMPTETAKVRVSSSSLNECSHHKSIFNTVDNNYNQSLPVVQSTGVSNLSQSKGAFSHLSSTSTADAISEVKKVETDLPKNLLRHHHHQDCQLIRDNDLSAAAAAAADIIKNDDDNNNTSSSFTPNELLLRDEAEELVLEITTKSNLKTESESWGGSLPSHSNALEEEMIENVPSLFLKFGSAVSQLSFEAKTAFLNKLSECSLAFISIAKNCNDKELTFSPSLQLQLDSLKTTVMDLLASSPSSLFLYFASTLIQRFPFFGQPILTPSTSCCSTRQDGPQYEELRRILFTRLAECVKNLMAASDPSEDKDDASITDSSEDADNNSNEGSIARRSDLSLNASPVNESDGPPAVKRQRLVGDSDSTWDSSSERNNNAVINPTTKEKIIDTTTSCSTLSYLIPFLSGLCSTDVTLANKISEILASPPSSFRRKGSRQKKTTHAWTTTTTDPESPTIKNELKISIPDALNNNNNNNRSGGYMKTPSNERDAELLKMPRHILTKGGVILPPADSELYLSKVVGVVWDKIHNSWVVNYTLLGKRYFQHFPAKKYGFLEGRKMAIELRLAKDREKSLVEGTVRGGGRRAQGPVCDPLQTPKRRRRRKFDDCNTDEGGIEDNRGSIVGDFSQKFDMQKENNTSKESSLIDDPVENSPPSNERTPNLPSLNDSNREKNEALACPAVSSDHSTSLSQATLADESIVMSNNNTVVVVVSSTPLDSPSIDTTSLPNTTCQKNLLISNEIQRTQGIPIIENCCSASLSSSDATYHCANGGSMNKEVCHKESTAPHNLIHPNPSLNACVASPSDSSQLPSLLNSPKISPTCSLRASLVASGPLSTDPNPLRSPNDMSGVQQQLTTSQSELALSSSMHASSVPTPTLQQQLLSQNSTFGQQHLRQQALESPLSAHSKSSLASTTLLNVSLDAANQSSHHQYHRSQLHEQQQQQQLYSLHLHGQPSENASRLISQNWMNSNI